MNKNRMIRAYGAGQAGNCTRSPYPSRALVVNPAVAESVRKDVDDAENPKQQIYKWGAIARCSSATSALVRLWCCQFARE